MAALSGAVDVGDELLMPRVRSAETGSDLVALLDELLFRDLVRSNQKTLITCVSLHDALAEWA